MAQMCYSYSSVRTLVCHKWKRLIRGTEEDSDGRGG